MPASSAKRHVVLSRLFSIGWLVVLRTQDTSSDRQDDNYTILSYCVVDAFAIFRTWVQLCYEPLLYQHINLQPFWTHVGVVDLQSLFFMPWLAICQFSSSWASKFLYEIVRCSSVSWGVLGYRRLTFQLGGTFHCSCWLLVLWPGQWFSAGALDAPLQVLEELGHLLARCLRPNFPRELSKVSDHCLFSC